MLVTLLQPLLILAAIAIVGAVPLLGAASPSASVGVSATSGAGTCTTAGHRGSADLAKVPSWRGAVVHAATRGPGPRCCAVAPVELGWAVCCGACVLPPPCA
jgi:hypothetical protein